MSKFLTLSSDVPIKLKASEPVDGEPVIPTVEIVGYTGIALKQPGFKYPVVADLQGMEYEGDRTPFLVNHDENQIAGHSNTISTDGKQLLASGVLSGPDDVTSKIIQTSKKKYPWQASIGATITKLEFVKPGETVSVNSRQFQGPVFIARESILREISLTPLGVDRSTSATIAANLGKSEMTFEEFCANAGVDASTLTPEQKAFLEQAYNATIEDESEEEEAPMEAGEKEPMEASAILDLRAKYAEETLRIAAINKVCGKHPEIAAKAISENWSPEKAELTVLRAARPTAPAIHSGFDKSTITNDVIVAGLVANSAKVAKKNEFLRESFSERTLEASNSKPVRDIVRHGFTGLCGLTLQAAGKHARPGKIDAEMFRAAVAADMELKASGFSEISLSVILGNYANKILLQSFNNVPKAIPSIAATTNLNDFKPHYRARLTASGKMEKVSPDGEIKHSAVSEESWSIKADTYAKMIALSRQDILNDDLGAFDQIPAQMGRQAALSVEEAGFTLLLSNPTGANGNAFFSSGNKNYSSGGSTPLGIDAVSAAEALFNSQVDSSGQPISIQPAILLVHPGNKVLAEQLYNDRSIVPVLATKAPSGNPHVGKFLPVWSPYLSNTTITGYSTTAWYLFADPADVPAMAVGYLNGQQTPTVEQVELDANQLAIGFRGYFDFGVGLVDYRAAVKFAGA